MHPRPISRRTVLGLGLGATAAFAVAGCGTSAKPSKTSHQALEVWSRSAPDGAATYEKVFEAFTQQTGIKVNYQPVMEFDKLLQSRAADKDLPDVWINDAGNLGTYQSQGWLTPISPNDIAGHDQIADNTWRQNVGRDGKTYGVPWSRQAFATIVRKDWREKLGLGVPKDWAELTALANAFGTRDPNGNGKNDTYGMVIPGTAKNGYLGWWAANYIFQAGGELLVRNGDQYASAVNTPQVAQAVEWIRDQFRTPGNVVPGSLNLTTTDAKGFAEGTGGIYLTGPYMWPGYDAAVGKENVEVIPMPRGPVSTASLAEGENIYFGAGSGRAEEQKKLAEFLITAEAQKIAMTPIKTKTGGVSQPVVRLPINKAVDVVAVTGDERWQVIADTYANNAKTFEWSINFQPFRRVLGEGLNAIMSNDSSDIAAGLASIDKEFTAELQKQGLVK